MTNLNKEISKPIFWNYPLDKGKLKSFVSWFLKQHGEKKTLELLEQLKVLGFGYATEAGISLGIEDLKIPPQKPKMIAKAQSLVSQFFWLHKKGKITNIEKTQGFIEIWNEVNESLKDEVVFYFQKTDILNPVYMMAFSGARGNLSQVRQLVGMRGLMSDPQGKIIDFPILSNFREGLTLTEYLISTYGARKGIVDTALRTATAGYLTRRLVDVAQHVIVSKLDCGTQRGIFLFDMKDEGKTIYAFQNRLTGRVLAQDIYNTDSRGQTVIVASKNQEIDGKLAALISKITKKALVRSPLTCENIKRVCQLCYGWSLATSRLVSIGEAVGVIAGQSIGEPGTQLTMRTFHTGGVFAGSISEQINAPFNSIVEYTTPMAGSLIRLPRGTQSGLGSVGIAFLTKASGTMILKPSSSLDQELPHDASSLASFASIGDLASQTTRGDGFVKEVLGTREKGNEEKNTASLNSVQTYQLPAFTVLFARHGEWVPRQSLLAQVSALTPGQKNTQISEQTVYSSLEGEVLYSQLDLMEDIDEKYGERVSKSEDWAKVWVLSAKIFQTPFLGLQESKKSFSKFEVNQTNATSGSHVDLTPRAQDFISKKTVMQEIDWVSPIGSSVSFTQNKNTKRAHMNSKKIQETYSFKPKVQRISEALWSLSLSFKSKEEKRNQTRSQISNVFSQEKVKKNGTLINCFPISNSFLEKVSKENRSEKIENNKSICCQILPNYQIRSKFLNGSSFRKRATFVQYSFDEQKKLLEVSRFLKNTQVFLPILEPGTFKKWLESKQVEPFSKTQRSGSLKISTGSLKRTQKTPKSLFQSLENSKASVFALTLKTLFLKENQTNYAQPLILNNEIPFRLPLKTLTLVKNQRRKRNKNGFQFEPSLGTGFKFEKNMSKAFSFSAQKTEMSVKNPENNFNQNSKRLALSLLKKEKREAREIELENKKSITKKRFLAKTKTMSFVENKNSEFQDLFMKEPILSFPTVRQHYSRLGYTGFVDICSTQKDQFLSFLPLKGEGFISSNFRALAQNALNRGDNFSGNLQSLTQNQQLQNSILRNTNDWQPKPTKGFAWYPHQTSIPSSFICLMHGHSVSLNFFQHMISQNFKNAKQNRLWQRKAVRILNLSQSQVLKKFQTGSIPSLANLNKKPTALFIKAVPKNKIFKKVSTPLKRNFNYSSSSAHMTKASKNVNLQTLSNRFARQIENSVKNMHSLKLFSKSKYAYYQKLNRKTGQDVLPKTIKKEGFYKFPKLASVEKKKNKIRNLKKSKIKKLKHLKIQLDETQKNTVCFKEIFYLPQQTYLFKTWNEPFLSKAPKKFNQSFYIQNKRSYRLQQQSSVPFIKKSTGPSFFLMNYQGARKKLNIGTLTSNGKPSLRAGQDSENQSQSIGNSMIENEGVLSIRYRKKDRRIAKRAEEGGGLASLPSLKGRETRSARSQKQEGLALEIQRKEKTNPFHSEFFLDFKQNKQSNSLGVKTTNLIKPSTFSQTHLYTLKLKFLDYIRTTFAKEIQKNQKHRLSLKPITEKNSGFLSHIVVSKKQKKYWTYLPFLKKTQDENFRENVKGLIGFSKNKKRTGQDILNFCNTYDSSRDESTIIRKALKARNKKLSFEKTKTQIQLNFKPGWVYLSSVNTPMFSKKKKKKIEQFGNHLIDDIHVEVEKVLLEPVVLPKKTTPEEKFRIQHKSFVPSKWYQNKNCRFFKISTERLASEATPKNDFNFKSFKPTENFYLLRPFQTQKVASTQEMKTNLYEKMKTWESTQSGFSYKLYKQYFYEELNPQKVGIHLVYKMPKLDIELQSINLFPKPNLTRWLSFFKKLKNKKRRIKRQEKKLSEVNKNQRKNEKREKSSLRTRPQNKSLKTLRSKPTSSHLFKLEALTSRASLADLDSQIAREARQGRGTEIQKKCQKKTHSLKTLLLLTKKEKKVYTLFKKVHFPLYFSNEGLNVSPFQIFYKLSNSDWEGYSFPSVSLNQEKNLLFLKASTKKQKVLIQNYLSFLLHRNLKQNLISAQLQKTQIKKPKYAKKLSQSKLQNKKPKNFESMFFYRPYFYSTPKFEFVLNMHYSLFLNARLRGIGSWKQSFEDSWKLNLSNSTKINNENFRLQRFFKKKDKQGGLSFQYLPVLKNFWNATNRYSNFHKQSVVGSTCFYSSYEGLVLKDYSFETNTANLEKTYNIHLDASLLKERQGQRLILTKRDLFVLNLPSLKKTSQVSKNMNRIEGTFGDKNLSKPKDFTIRSKNLTTFNAKQAFFQKPSTRQFLKEAFKIYGQFQQLEQDYLEATNLGTYKVSNFSTIYENKTYKLKEVEFGFCNSVSSISSGKWQSKVRIGQFLYAGDSLYGDICLPRSGQLIHLNSMKVTFRKAEYFSLSPKTILHTYNGHTIQANAPVMTLPFETLKTGDIVQGIPKVEQYLEARTTIQGRLFLNSLPMLLYAIYRRYLSTLEMEKAARQSFLKIQQILVDGVQRVYRSQGVGITDKHLEVIVRQMTSKVKIIYGGQTGFFPGELVDLDFVERVNKSLMVKVIYEPVVLGITRASLEVDSFLSAASFQQTTKVLTRSAIENKRDFLKGLKENLLVGNLLPAGTGYVVPISNTF